MSRIVIGVLVSITFVLMLAAQENDASLHVTLGEQSQAVPQPQINDNLPASEETAKMVLEKSPRHGEFIEIKYEGSQYPIRTWIVYPERKDKAPVVIVIHEIFGLSDWLRAVADQFAKEGFIAVAPDLISGMGPGGGGTESVGTRDSVVQLIRGLSAEETYKRLNAVRAYALTIPAATDKMATVGYCWGGGRSFGYACVQPGLNAAVAYYGTSPDSSDLVNLRVPVLGLYGGDDARVTATIQPAVAVLKRLNRVYQYEVYEGAGHGFLRAQSGRNGANLRATEKAWPRMLEFLREYLGE
jgi:carboxymethylenebutenolidase